MPHPFLPQQPLKRVRSDDLVGDLRRSYLEIRSIVASESSSDLNNKLKNGKVVLFKP